jgi:hypothetical protein
VEIHQMKNKNIGLVFRAKFSKRKKKLAEQWYYEQKDLHALLDNNMTIWTLLPSLKLSLSLEIKTIKKHGYHLQYVAWLHLNMKVSMYSLVFIFLPWLWSFGSLISLEYHQCVSLWIYIKRDSKVRSELWTELKEWVFLYYK